jgi:hypothetical protein
MLGQSAQTIQFDNITNLRLRQISEEFRINATRFSEFLTTSRGVYYSHYKYVDVTSTYLYI